MKRMITGDTDFADLVIANAAIDQHIKLHGDGNLGHEVLHKVQYRGVTKWVEVTTRRTQYTACVMNGKRELQRICYAGGLES